MLQSPPQARTITTRGKSQLENFLASSRTGARTGYLEPISVVPSRKDLRLASHWLVCWWKPFSVFINGSSNGLCYRSTKQHSLDDSFTEQHPNSIAFVCQLPGGATCAVRAGLLQIQIICLCKITADKITRNS